MRVSLPLKKFCLNKKFSVDLRMYSYKNFCQHFFAFLPKKNEIFSVIAVSKNFRRIRQPFSSGL